MNIRNILSIALLSVASATVYAGPIKVNQVGYYPNGEKIAVLEKEAKAKSVKIVDAAGQTVWTGTPVREAVSPWSGKTRQIIDFTSFRAPGAYTMVAGKQTEPIIIRDHALQEISNAALNMFTLQRCQHPDDKVLIHESAADANRAAYSTISSPGGWYDAGDYNKYIVNSGYTVAMLMYAAQLFPEYTRPILDETLVNLQWMTTMQDPNDGGVYHKLTTANFEGFIMPAQCMQTRYVVQKTVTASLDFAASLAMAARIYKTIPGYAKLCPDFIVAAERAFAWAICHPNALYNQDEMNKTYKPAITTGTYGDNDASDEYYWAATELYLTTGRDIYRYIASQYAPKEFSLPTWGSVASLGTYSMILQNKVVPETMTLELETRLSEVGTSCYQSPCGNRAADFGWGCNAESFCNVGVAMLIAYQVTGSPRYLNAAYECAANLLGLNATGYCYVTGFGTKQVMNPHHRLSAADGIEAPLPGFLAGGPNPNQQDKSKTLKYPSSQPDESYLDKQESYASNEIAINWNAPLVFLLAGLETYMK